MEALKTIGYVNFSIEQHHELAREEYLAHDRHVWREIHSNHEQILQNRQLYTDKNQQIIQLQQQIIDRNQRLIEQQTRQLEFLRQKIDLYQHSLSDIQENTLVNSK